MKISLAAIAVLTQLADVTRQLSAKEYNMPIERLGSSTLGQHIRHTLEFFICLYEGCASGRVNYDNRRRDPEIEEDPEAALKAINRIQKFLETSIQDTTLKLEVNYNIQDGDAQVLDTNFDRELAYNIEHAVHHMAILKIGLQELIPDIELPTGFGVAISTLRHRKGQAQIA